MIQKEKIRGVGYFLMALAAGLLPFAAPDACAQALREGLALCGGPLLLSLFSSPLGGLGMVSSGKQNCTMVATSASSAARSAPGPLGGKR